MSHIALNVPEINGAKGNFGQDVLNFLELLLKGVFPSGQYIEQIFTAILILETFAIVVFFNIFDFLDLIFIVIFVEILLLALVYAF